MHASPAGLEPAPVSQLLCDQRGVKSGRVRGAPPKKRRPRGGQRQGEQTRRFLPFLPETLSLGLANLLEVQWADEWVGRYVSRWLSRCAGGGAIASCSAAAAEQDSSLAPPVQHCPLGTSYLPPQPPPQNLVQLRSIEPSISPKSVPSPSGEI